MNSLPWKSRPYTSSRDDKQVEYDYGELFRVTKTKDNLLAYEHELSIYQFRDIIVSLL